MSKYPISKELLEETIAQLEEDEHFELAAKLRWVRYFTRCTTDGWGNKDMSDAELRSVQGIYG